MAFKNNLTSQLLNYDKILNSTSSSTTANPNAAEENERKAALAQYEAMEQQIKAMSLNSHCPITTKAQVVNPNGAYDSSFGAYTPPQPALLHSSAQETTLRDIDCHQISKTSPVSPNGNRISHPLPPKPVFQPLQDRRIAAHLSPQPMTSPPRPPPRQPRNFHAPGRRNAQSARAFGSSFSRPRRFEKLERRQQTHTYVDLDDPVQRKYTKPWMTRGARERQRDEDDKSGLGYYYGGTHKDKSNNGMKGCRSGSSSKQVFAEKDKKLARVEEKMELVDEDMDTEKPIEWEYEKEFAKSWAMDGQ